MKILAFESSAKAAGVALCEDDFLIAQSFQNNGLTHSTTLLPLADDLLKRCGVALAQVDCLAVAVGPGSFTGLRIGISTVKGLAWGAEKPCVGVSTLESMAWQMAHTDSLICCAMDARRNQVYQALFRSVDGVPTRLTPDRAVSLAELEAELQPMKEKKIAVGDGAELCSRSIADLSLAPPHLRYQTAWGVARAALERARRGETVSGDRLNAAYLRPSQAERERAERQNREREKEK